jgi:RNA polymerase sigma factor (sigma-70 family)
MSHATVLVAPRCESRTGASVSEHRDGWEANERSGRTYESLEAFIERRRSGLEALAYTMGLGHHDAQDLVQEAFISLVPHWDRVNASGEPDKYVATTIRNRSKSRHRWFARHREVLSEQPLLEVSAAQVAAEVRDYDHLMEAINRLPERVREVVALRFFEDFTPVEVAEITRQSRRNADRLTKVGLQFLLGYLTQAGSPDE